MKDRVAIIREEGSNGECEMIVRVAGFGPWDVHVRDLLSGRIMPEDFRGIVFVGRFSYADVHGAVTMEYSIRSNGSEGAIVGLMSLSGRHLRFISPSTKALMKTC